MRRRFAALVIFGLVFPIWGVTSIAMAASETSHQTTKRTVEPAQVKLGDQITVYKKSGSILELIVTKISASGRATFDVDITGTYVSNITSNSLWAFKKRYRKLIITFEQSGNNVIARDSSNSVKIGGTRIGNTISFYMEPNAANGFYDATGEWKVSTDGNSLEGYWKTSGGPDDGTGKWNLTRIDPKLETPNAEPPMIKGKLILDQTSVEVLLVDIDKIEIQHTITTIEASTETKCQINETAQNAIDDAVESAIKDDRIIIEALDLIDQAEEAAGPPECDSVRAKFLADKAKGLAELDAINPKSTIISDTSNTSIDDQPIIIYYDGAWEFGLTAEIIEQKDVKGASFIDTLFDDKYGLIIGKEFYKTKSWFLGGQVHILKSNVDEIVEMDDVTFDATNIFVTARHEALSALQFKVGVSRAKYENFFESNSETGLVYGIALTSETNWGWRIHWLDYEVYKLGDDEFKSYSVNLFIVICFWAAVLGGGGC